MNVAGHRISRLMSSIAIRVWGQNIATMNTSAAPIGDDGLDQRSGAGAASRSRSSAASSSSSVAAAAPGSALAGPRP